MIDTQLFGTELKALGFNYYSGVPCSFLKSLINYAINECNYIAASNEGDAIAIAAGAYTGGTKSIVLMQNSGLTNAISPLTSLNYPFKIPVLGFVSLRGEDGINDEPQHELMGQITAELIKTMKIEYDYLSQDQEIAIKQIKKANEYIEKRQSFIFIIKKGTFNQVDLKKVKILPQVVKEKKNRNKRDQYPYRFEVLGLINKLKNDNTVHIATTGKTGRELHDIEDARNNLYMVGSMGCASSFGLGLSMTKMDKDIVVLDGDGSLLMRMGSLGTIGYYNPKNLLHIVLDNNSYDSTGGQNTVSSNMNFVEIASASGYAKAYHVHSLDELEKFIKDWKKSKSLTFLYIRIAKGSMKNLGRPKLKPDSMFDRLRGFLGE
jgi:phosphonopyruvate decarboxylase